MKADECVEVTIQVCGRSQLGWLGYATDRDHPLGIRKVFGLCTWDGYLTHMSYASDYADPREMLTFTVKNTKGVFYFDAGSNGRPVTISHLELAQAFQKLGLI